ncbi:enterobactin exporter EntS [Nocardia otitidiscaviarum]|uniref:Enterobactin exporter EntS n=1 Tax=Nocardia otitidiscaviarum TaxID=1823 RepID=A0A379JGJ7_9NOCA|nr:MFS transporter [Nocardia otitidiscaviarum]SUD47585.1 enterobactin exporter EntS [Nocardia otitidiscaviarum]
MEVLRHRRFRRLFTAQVVALIGTGLLTVALGLLAYDIAGSRAGAVLGTALAIKMVAYVFVAPVISAVAERVPRKLLLLSADAVRAAVAVLLPFVTQVWQIYALIFVLQAASATFTPAFQAVIPAILVEERQYTRALSLSRVAYDLESLLSPALAAALLTVLGYHLLFLGTAAGFAVSAAMVVGTALPRLTAVPTAESLPRRITAGARAMLALPALRALLVMNLAVAAATALVVVNTVVYVRELLHGTATGVAVALGCFGFGSLTVALATPRLLAALGDRRLMLTGTRLLAAGSTAAAALTPLLDWPLLACTWMALGAGTSLVNTPAARLLRAGSPPGDRTAVFTAQFSLSHAAFLLTYPIAGWAGALAGRADPAGGLFVAAAVLAAIATLAAMAAARLWPVSAPAGTGGPVSVGR